MENQVSAIDPHHFPTFKKNEYNLILRFLRVKKYINKTIVDVTDAHSKNSFDQKKSYHH